MTEPTAGQRAGQPAARLVVPRYHDRALSDVLPALLSAIGLSGFTNHLGLAPASSAGVLVIDGLGWELLRAHAEDAPYLNGLADGAEPLTAGFPATTAVSVTSLGTGRPPGEHGIVGYTFALPEPPLLNALRWQSNGVPRDRDPADPAWPEDLQPRPTALELAAAQGARITVAGPTVMRGSGLSRAALRGGEFAATYALGDLAAILHTSLAGGPGAFCYAYHGDLDGLGHRYGPGTLAWRRQLSQLDHLVATIARDLPRGALLAVVADHGMVAVDRAELVDADTTPALLAGVRMLGGDLRARYVYTEPGAAEDVLAAWRDTLGARALVCTRAEAVAAGWFGSAVEDRIAARIGDVVAVMLGRGGVARIRHEPAESALIGHHGALTSAEQLVPGLLIRP
jgi:hypothetical protein